MSECPCDSCRFKSMNFKQGLSGNRCPNFKFFFDAVMLAYDGKLKTDVCEKWERME